MQDFIYRNKAKIDKELIKKTIASIYPDDSNKAHHVYSLFSKKLDNNLGCHRSAQILTAILRKIDLTELPTDIVKRAIERLPSYSNNETTNSRSGFSDLLPLLLATGGSMHGFKPVLEAQNSGDKGACDLFLIAKDGRHLDVVLPSYLYPDKPDNLPRCGIAYQCKAQRTESYNRFDKNFNKGADQLKPYGFGFVTIDFTTALSNHINSMAPKSESKLNQIVRSFVEDRVHHAHKKLICPNNWHGCSVVALEIIALLEIQLKSSHKLCPVDHCVWNPTVLNKLKKSEEKTYSKFFNLYNHMRSTRFAYAGLPIVPAIPFEESNPLCLGYPIISFQESFVIDRPL